MKRTLSCDVQVNSESNIHTVKPTVSAPSRLHARFQSGGRITRVIIVRGYRPSASNSSDLTVPSGKIWGS